jgi:hypothetical protein
MTRLVEPSKELSNILEVTRKQESTRLTILLVNNAQQSSDQQYRWIWKVSLVRQTFHLVNLINFISKSLRY